MKRNFSINNAKCSSNVFIIVILILFYILLNSPKARSQCCYNKEKKAYFNNLQISYKGISEDTNGLIDYDVTRYKVDYSVYQDANVTSNDYLPDNYEPDNDPNYANPILINDTMSPQLHNLHDPDDIDWVLFHLYPDRNYEIWINKENNWRGCPLKANLYTIDGEQISGYDNSPLVLEFSDNFGRKMAHIYPDLLPYPGYYYLKFYYGCSEIPPEASTEYEIVEITESHAGYTGIICGHVRHSEYDNGIAGAEITVEKKLDNGNIKHIEDTFSGKGGVFYLFDLTEGDYQVHADAPGFYNSNEIPVTINKNSVININLYLAPNPKDLSKPSSGRYTNIQNRYNTIVQRRYKDWDREHIITLYQGLNLISFPYQLKDPSSSYVIQAVCNFITKYFEEDNFFVAISTYDNIKKDWHNTYMDYINPDSQIKGDTLNINSQQGYLVYVDLKSTNQSLDSLSIPLTCTQNDPEKDDFILKPGMSLTSFNQSVDDNYINNLLQKADFEDNLRTILHYNVQKGSFCAHYQFFCKPPGSSSCQINEEKGYILFQK